jgi:hypothetical protein
MFKHITLCLILASALNCIFLKKINISEVACKKVAAITKDLNKLDQDRKTFGEGVKKHIRKLEEQIAALKRKITDKGVQLRKYNVKYQNTKRTKQAELKTQQKICDKKVSLEKELGSARELQASIPPYKKPPRPVTHKKHPRPVAKKQTGKYNAWGKKEQTNAKIDAKAEGQSFGNGESTSVAGPSGAQSTAHGTKGAKTGTGFQANIHQRGSNWGVDQTTGKKSAFGKTYSSDTNVDARGNAQGFGQASVGSRAGLDGSENFAQGTKGTKTGASWKGNTNSKENSWGFKAQKHYDDDE